MSSNKGDSRKSIHNREKSRASLIKKFHDSRLRDINSIAEQRFYLCGWSSLESQLSRFKALLRVVNFQGGSIVDYGCGTGDLFRYLAETDIDFKYLGLDMNPKMLAVAKEGVKANFGKIFMDSVDFPVSDYVFASGVFQFKDWSSPYYYKKLISTLFDRCKVGLAVNLLSDQRDETEKDPEELYLSPTDAVEMCRRLSGRWILDHSYHPGRGDMTLGILKGAESAHWRRPRTT